jgi:hypothetical protein
MTRHRLPGGLLGGKRLYCRGPMDWHAPYVHSCFTNAFLDDFVISLWDIVLSALACTALFTSVSYRQQPGNRHFASLGSPVPSGGGRI